MHRSLLLLTAACRLSAAQPGITGSIVGFLQRVTPAPIVQPEDWDGIEYRYKRIVFRPARKATRFFPFPLHRRFSIQSSRPKAFFCCAYSPILSYGSLADVKTTAEQPHGMLFRLVFCPCSSFQGSMPTFRSLRHNFLNPYLNPKTSCKMAHATSLFTALADGVSCLSIRPSPSSRAMMSSLAYTTFYGRCSTSRIHHVTKFNLTSRFSRASRRHLLYGASLRRTR